jgi:hypothetical protein
MITWRDVPGWEGLYQVSDAGNVRSLDRTIRVLDAHGNMGSRRYKGRMLRPGSMPKGYKGVVLSSPATGQRFLCVHWLVCAAFHGPRPSGLQVRHLDGDPANNAARNLCYGTPLENAADTIRHGRTGLIRGVQIGTAKLNDDIVRDIRTRANVMSQAAIARWFHVSPETIRDVMNGKNWRHVQ